MSGLTPDDIPPEMRELLDRLGIDPDQIIVVGEGELSKMIATSDLMPGDERSPDPHVVYTHEHPQNFKRNAPPPERMTEGVPSIIEADETGVPFAYLRFYAQTGRGEWYVLGMNSVERAFCWVVSPWGERYDEYGVIDLTALDYYSQVFDCGPIVLDVDFHKTPFTTTPSPHVVSADDRQE